MKSDTDKEIQEFQDEGALEFVLVVFLLFVLALIVAPWIYFLISKI